MRAQARKDVKPPPHWRLEAIAADAAAALADGARTRRAVFIQDAATPPTCGCSTSTATARPSASPPAASRSPTGRTRRRGSRRTAPRSPTPTAATCGSCRPPAGRRASWWRAASPVWVDDARLVIAVERDDDDAPRGGRRRRPLAAAPGRRARRARRQRRRGRGRRLARRHARSPTPSRPAATSTAARSASPRSTAAPCARSPARRACTTTARVVAGRRDDRLRVRAQRLLRAPPRGGRRTRAADERRRGPPRARRGTPTARACSPSADARRRFDLVTVDAATGEAEVVAEGGAWGGPQWTAAAAVVATYEDHAHAAGAAPRRCGGAPRTPPRRAASRRAPYAALEEVTFRVASTAWRSRPSCAGRRRVGRAPGARHRLPARRADRRLRRRVGRPRAVLRRQGLRVAGAQLPRLDRLRARVRARSTTASGACGDTEDCLAAADYLRTLDWVDGERLGIFGASYGSYMALPR